MKKIFSKIVWILILGVLISNIPVTGVSAASKKYVKALSVTKKTLKILTGKNKSVSYKVKVHGKASKKVSVKTSNSNVKAVVKKNGKIEIWGKKAGSSKVTVSTKGKNRKGKKINKTIKVTVKKKQTPAKNPPSGINTKVKVSRKEWIAAVMKTAGFMVQKELFNKDTNGNIAYSFIDIVGLSDADIIETAVKYGIIPASGGMFRPDEAADREFLAVTAVRSVGLAANGRKADYSDKTDLKYEAEDVIAVSLKLIELSHNNFLPAKAITVKEKDTAIKILAEIIDSRKIDENHMDVVKYSEDVELKDEVKDYTVSTQSDKYVVETSKGTSLDDVSKGDKIVLPATNDCPEGIALVVESNMLSSDGSGRVVTGTIPDQATDFLDKVDIEGTAEVDVDNITAVDNVATVGVESAKHQKICPGKKQKSVEGKTNPGDGAEVVFVVKEINTTVSFKLTSLKYKVDFNKKGVQEMYFGLPNVLSFDTDYKAKKNFSEKIGDIPVELPAGFSVNIEVYLEASMGGEITMNLSLSNNVGMQYLNGQFSLVKNCEPEFDMVMDTDLDAGVKLQLGMYWMKGVMEILGKEAPSPLYNVNTKWGMHGDVARHVRNDKYTDYQNLSCVDLGYYLYGKISVGDGSVLGDKFSLKKTWNIFDEKNSPLNGDWHLENGKKINKCTYKTDDITESEYILFRLDSENDKKIYRGTVFNWCEMADEESSYVNICFDGETDEYNFGNPYGVNLLTNGEIVYYEVNDTSGEKISVYQLDLSNGIKTKVFSLPEYDLSLSGYYKDCLYYTKGIDPGKFCKYDMKLHKQKELVGNADHAVQYGQHYMLTPYEGDYWYTEIKVFDAVSEKVAVLSDKALMWNVIDGEVYMVLFKKTCAAGDDNPVTNCICDVVKCDFSGRNAVKLITDIRINGQISEVTSTYVKIHDDMGKEFVIKY